jgi:hypothetical protein
MNYLTLLKNIKVNKERGILLNITGEITFRISGKKLDFIEIQKNININPTKIIKKDQYIVGNKRAPYDIWLYEKKTNGDFKGLRELLDEILPFSLFIKRLKKNCFEVSLDCYFRSDYGQIGFELFPDIIDTLNELGLGINFHILSFGGVVD